MLLKNDIKLIPFNSLYKEWKEYYEDAKEEAQEKLREYVIKKNEELIADKAQVIRARYARLYKNLESNEAYELGSDKFESEAREELTGLADPNKVELDGEELYEIYNDSIKQVIEPFIARHSLNVKFSWVLQQVMARIGSWKPIKSPDSDLYNGRLTFENAVKESSNPDFEWGMLLYLNQKRSTIIKTGPGVRLYEQTMFNPLVPMFLASFKMYQNIPYSKWERSKSSLARVVDGELLEAMLCEVPELTVDEKLHIQKVALTIKDSKIRPERIGTLQDPVTCWRVSHLRDDELSVSKGILDLPRLAQFMVIQTWCAHPANRNKYQILDPNDWDNMPEPLLTSKVLEEAPKIKRKTPVRNKEYWGWDV